MPPVSRASEPPADDAPSPADDVSEPIRVEEPATASVGSGDADDEGAPDGGDRSLRELFWGEE